MEYKMPPAEINWIPALHYPRAEGLGGTWVGVNLDGRWLVRERDLVSALRDGISIRANTDAVYYDLSGAIRPKFWELELYKPEPATDPHPPDPKPGEIVYKQPTACEHHYEMIRLEPTGGTMAPKVTAMCRHCADVRVRRAQWVPRS